MREAIEPLDIVKIWTHLGGELPAHLIDSRWNPVRCLVHGGDSGSIYPDINRWYCFGCEERGDGYDLLRLVEGIQLQQAREMAADMGWYANTGPARGPARRPRGAAARRPDRTERGRKPERR